MNISLIIPYILLAVILFVAELVYFRLAIKYRIVDKPNERSSHIKPVIRGGGIIFTFSLWLWYFNTGQLFPFFIAGVTLVAVVSFVDDLFPQQALVRFILQLIAVALIFYQLNLFHWPLWLVIPALIICIGTINAFNFMDGINGITGVYALITLLTFWLINRYVVAFTNTSLLLTVVVSVVVFLFFNFRKTARCFAGDVGSITLAYIIIFILLQLIYHTDNYAWALLLLVYGTDSVLTIVYRLKSKENIFKAHRTHLYQYLSNEFKKHHLWVSVIYGLMQIIVNVIVILYFKQFDWFSIAFLLLFMFAYIVIREMMLKRLGVQG